MPSRAAADSAAYDPFDPASIRVTSLVDIEVEKVLTAVPVRRPKRTEFVRVHPDASYCIDARILERDNGMETAVYLVDEAVAALVAEEIRLTRLFTAITKRGLVFLWPVKLPQEGNDVGRRIADTALQAADQARSLWVRVAWNRDLGGYDLSRAKGDLGDPQWPEKSFRDLLEIAFRHNLIDRPDHPVIRELAGEL